MAEEIGFSKIVLQATENGESLLDVTTHKSFMACVYDGDNQECIGRMDSAEAGLSFIQGSICCLLTSMLNNDLDVKEIRGVLHELVDNLIDDYSSEADPLDLN